MNTSEYKISKRKRRHVRVRSKISGTAERPRLSVFRSNHFIYAQIINDETSKTLVQSSDQKETSGTKIERAELVGKNLAKLALAQGLTKVVFDRGGYLYTGRVKALAEAARKEGLIF
ncbi:MAG: 50S ribosomal protein L18 [Candidatus Pacebacteria bacterium]|nr:50S ribosomal protein L18 [Candidatus Paceibacterota bacterium]